LLAQGDRPFHAASSPFLLRCRALTLLPASFGDRPSPEGGGPGFLHLRPRRHSPLCPLYASWHQVGMCRNGTRLLFRVRAGLLPFQRSSRTKSLPLPPLCGSPSLGPSSSAVCAGNMATLPPHDANTSVCSSLLPSGRASFLAPGSFVPFPLSDGPPSVCRMKTPLPDELGRTFFPPLPLLTSRTSIRSFSLSLGPSAGIP